METAPNQAKADSAAPAEAVVTTPASEAPASSLKQPDLAARFTEAKGFAEVNALLRAVRSAKPEPPKPVETPAPAEEVATPEGSETAQAPAAEEVTTEATPETPATPEDDEQEDAEGPITPITGKAARLRFSDKDQVGRMAASIMKRNRDLSMEEAIVRAKDHLGIKTPVQEVKTAETSAKSNLPQTVEEVDQTLASLEDAHDKATIELNFEEAAKLNRQIRQMDRQRIVLEQKAVRERAEASTAYDTQFNQSSTKASDLYEFAGNPESAGGKRMLEIDAALQENGDPLYHDPNRPLKIAQMVAAELSIAPRRKGAPAAPARPAAPQVPAPKRQMLPTGASRTAPPVSQPTVIADAVSKIGPRDVRGVQALLRTYGLKT